MSVTLLWHETFTFWTGNSESYEKDAKKFWMEKYAVELVLSLHI